MSQANKECHCVRRINEDSQSKPHRKNEFKKRLIKRGRTTSDGKKVKKLKI